MASNYDKVMKSPLQLLKAGDIDVKRTEKTSNNTSSPDERRKLPLFRYNWWWETGAIAISLVAMTLLVAILLRMNGEALHTWHLPIQLNSLIAIFSTISKTSLLVALAEGLSQLKWNQFEKPDGATLDQLQIFDDASRGPWGAFMFPLETCRMKVGALPLLGAVLTATAIAFEPFTQQVIKFPSRIVPFANESATLRTADAYYMPPDPMVYLKEGPKLTMARDILNLLPNPTAQGDLHITCWTGDCVFPEHWTLGACERCYEQILDDISADVEYTGYPEYISTVKVYENLTSLKAALDIDGGRWYDSIFARAMNMSVANNFLAGAIIEVNTPINSSFNDPVYITQPFDFGLWGEQGINLNYTEPDKFMTDSLVSIHHSTLATGFPAYQDFENWEGIKILSRRCDITFCAKYIKNVTVTRGSVVLAEEKSFPLEFSRACDSAECQYSNATIPGESPVFKVHADARVTLSDAIAEVATRVLYMGLTNKYLVNETAADLANILSKVITSSLRSEQNFNSTELHGSASGLETYIRVQWLWVLFPVSLVIASAIFLAVTIAESNGKQQLYKTSVLPGYFHNFVVKDQESAEEGNAIAQRRNSELRGKNNAHALESKSRGVQLTLRRARNGRLEMMKVG